MKRLYFVALLALACVPAFAASFDCTKAKRPVEFAVCSDRELSAADTRLATAYRADLSRLSSNSVGLLRVDQVQWPAYAQQVCAVNAPATTKAAAAACLKPIYDARAKQLHAAVAVRDGLTFLTRTQFLAAPEAVDPNGPHWEHEGFGTLQVEWPAADTDIAEWIQWNAAMEARVLKTAGAGHEQDLPSGTKRVLPMTWDDTMAAETDTQIIAVLKSVEHGRVTSVISTQGMVHGGAHPFESEETMTWLLAQKRGLRAEDVFAPAADWKARMAALCWDDLKQQNAEEKFLYDEVNGPDAQPIKDVVADTTNWTLEEDGLHISYPNYTVAARLGHPDDTTIPWSGLKGLLATTFVPPSSR